MKDMPMSSPITIVHEESTLEQVHSLLKLGKEGISLVVAVASYARHCQSLLDEISTSLLKDWSRREKKANTSNFNSLDLRVLILKVDYSDQLEEIAVELGLNAIPSYQIYNSYGSVTASSDDTGTVSYRGIFDALEKSAAVLESAFSDLSLGTYDIENENSAPLDRGGILKLVAESYANAHSSFVSVDSTMNGYSAEDLATAGSKANLGLGCGNPISFAKLLPGETVVDLGSGAGIDCFLAREKVGATGNVIGIDMTQEMINAARSNAIEKGELMSNVHFRLGEIEHLPLDDESVDCIISNCVINLSPDKAQVFRDMYRVLIDGGRIAISDVVVRPEKVLPSELRTEHALAC